MSRGIVERDGPLPVVVLSSEDARRAESLHAIEVVHRLRVLLHAAGELTFEAGDAALVEIVRELIRRADTTATLQSRANYLRDVEAQLNNRLRAVYQFTGRELGMTDVHG